MRYAVVVAVLALSVPAGSQTVTTPDSALMFRILSAEDRRDAVDRALTEGLASTDERVRNLAQRALWRIKDPRFAARDSLPALPAPPVVAEPAWKLRWRALTDKSPCADLGIALSDEEWIVRLHAMDLVRPECASTGTMVQQLRAFGSGKITLPHASGGVSWHPAAHAIVALAKVDALAARSLVQQSLQVNNPWYRGYAVRAAAVLNDTATLVSYVKDADDNVREAAIDALSKLTGHLHDDLYLAALNSGGAQAVRAAALALKGSPRADVPTRLNATFDKWVTRNNASSRDVRVALLGAAGRPLTDDVAPPLDTRIPSSAVPLALGSDVRLRVTMSNASGGGSFTVKLRGDIAPIMSAKVLELTRQKYYDGGVWHRVEHDFVIQGAGPGNVGQPDGKTPPPNEYVGAARFLRDEVGNVPHTRGTVGMSTRSHDTGDAQWFVNLKDNLRLGRDYTVFAEVVDGIAVVDHVLEGDVIESIREVPPKPR